MKWHKIADYNRRIIGLISLLIAFLILSYSFAKHTTSIDISPEWTKGGQSYIFTITITNTGGDRITYVKIQVPTSPSPFTLTDCEPAPPGWIVDESDLALGICRYSSTEGITEGDYVNFSITATTASDEETYNWSVMTRDIYDKWGPEQRPVTKIDNTPPSTTISPDGTMWTNQDVDFTLTCEDGGSGCEQTYYEVVNKEESCSSVGSASYVAGNTGTVTCDAGSICEKKVCFYSVDTLGNKPTESSKSGVFKIDKKAPQAPTMQPEPLYTQGTSNEVCWSSVTDEGSGDVQYYVEYDDDPSFNSPNGNSGWITETCFTFDGLLDGTTYYYHVKAKDGLGNEGKWSDDVSSTQDNTPPFVSVISPNGGEVWAGGSTQKIIWDATDPNMADSPISIYYSYDGSGWIEIATNEENDGVYEWVLPTINSANVLVKVVAVDKAGNKGEDTSDSPFTIDSEPPHVEVTGAPDNWVVNKNGINAGINCIDEISECDIESYKFKFYDEEPESCSSNYEEYIEENPVNSHVWVCAAAKDLAGNVGFSSPVEFKVETSIQAAIDAASKGETIEVSDGTYEEKLVIDKELTIKANSTPVLDGQNTLTNPAVKITAENVIFQGFIIQNYICTGADTSSDAGAILVEGDSAKIYDNEIRHIICSGTEGCPCGLGIDVSANNVEIKNNKIYNISSIGIRVRAMFGCPDIQKQNILIEGSEIYDTGNSGILVVGNVRNVTIKNNTLHDSDLPTPYNLFIAHGPDREVMPDDVKIYDNTIFNAYSNLIVAGAKNIDIVGNEIHGTFSLDGKLGKNIYIMHDYLWTNELSENILVKFNEIYDGGYGIRLLYTGDGDASEMASSVFIHYNDIYGHSAYGVENMITTTVDATHNYWGCPEGPGNEGCDKVKGNVEYEPWLKDSAFNPPVIYNPQVIPSNIVDEAIYTNDNTPTISLNTDRPSTCRYSIDESKSYEEMFEFDTTDQLEHIVTLEDSLEDGSHIVYVKCNFIETGAISEDDYEITFIVDTKSPDISIYDILEFVNSLTEVNGTATDEVPGMIQHVKIQISYSESETIYYWDGSGWLTQETWLDAEAKDGAFDSPGEEWYYSNLPEWQDGTVYEIKAMAYDAATNPSLVVTDSFTYDVTKPIISNVEARPSPFSPAVSPGVNDEVTIYYTLSEDSFVTIELFDGNNLIRTLLENELQSQGENQVVWDGKTESGNYVSDNAYTFVISCVDRAGNSVESPATGEIRVDNTLPQIVSYEIVNRKFSPNNDGIKDKLKINLEFSETVDYEINIKDKTGQIVKSWTGKATNSESKEWDGDGNTGEGVYTVGVIITDAAGNTFVNDTEKIVLDITLPDVNVTGVPTPTDWTNQDIQASVKCEDQESLSGCDENSYRLYVSDQELESCPTDYSLYNLTPPQTISSHVWVCAAAKDLAGNVGFSSPVEFKVDKDAPYFEKISTDKPYYKDGDEIEVTIWADDETSGIQRTRVDFTPLGGTVEECSLQQDGSYLCQSTINQPLNGTYEVLVIAEDLASNENQTYIDVIVDNIPPVVNVTGNISVEVGQPILIEANITDGISGVGEVELCYAELGGDTTCVPMTENEVFQAEIPAQSESTTIVYNITAVDNVGNVVISEDYYVRVYDLVINLVPGWNLISIPREVSNPEIGDLFSEGDLLYYYDPSQGWLFCKVGDACEFDELEPLKGYWVYTDDYEQIGVDYERISGNKTPLPSLELQPGWNLIGHTATSPMYADEALISLADVSCFLDSCMYSYSYAYVIGYVDGLFINIYTPGYSEPLLMYPGIGYWIYMKEAATLLGIEEN